MAHSWVQMFDDEYSAFRAYAEKYPDSCMRWWIHTTPKIGIPNAIKVFNEVIVPRDTDRSEFGLTAVILPI